MNGRRVEREGRERERNGVGGRWTAAMMLSTWCCTYRYLIRSYQIKKNIINDRRNLESGKIAAILILSHEWICVRCCCMSAECMREPCMKHTTLPPLYTVYVVHAVYAVRWRKRRGRPLSYRCPRYNPPTSTP